MVGYINTTDNNFTGTQAINNYYITETNSYFNYEDEIEKQFFAWKSHLEYLEDVELLKQHYTLLIYVALHQKIYHHKVNILKRITVKSTCPPYQRSIKGGKRK